MNAPTQGTVYPVLPLRDIVVFPGMIVPLFVGREKSVKALEEVMKDDKQILLIAQKNATQDDPGPDDIYNIGTLGTVLQLLKLPDDTVKVLVEGGRRVRIARLHRQGRVLRGARRRDGRADRRSGRAAGRCAHRGLGVRELREAQQEGAARGRGLDQQDRGAGQARRHHLRAPGAQGRRQAAAARARLGVEAAGAHPRPDGRRDRRPAGREEDPQPREAPDGEDAARVLSQRADEGDPEGAWRDRGRSRRDLRAGEAHQEDAALARRRARRPMAS